MMEYILRSIMYDKPANPRAYIKQLTAAPLPAHIIIAGPPASGKGTQCAQITSFIKRKTGKKPIHLSSGDLLRDQVSRQTQLGKIAEGYMKEGKLVPDSLIIGMIREKLQEEEIIRNGWLLDGFPRNDEQAKALDAEGFAPDLFVFLDTPDDILVERVEGRRRDPVTNTIYHMKYNPPPEDDYALLDRLERRDDDSREVLMPRLKEYHRYVGGLLKHYAAVAQRIDANRPEMDVTGDITQRIQKYRLA